MMIPNNGTIVPNYIVQRPNAISPPPMGGIRPRPQPARKAYLQKTTKNKSFLDMHNYLKSLGIKNNAFMLVLIDPDLDGIDPYDPNLNVLYKQKILRECMCNYWYFIREVVRIPGSGGNAPYKLHRGNLALNFCMSLNLNVFFELPRQQGKTVSAAIRYLYIYNFGTTNSKMAFLHKGMDGAKDNLQTIKTIRDALPPYLIMKERLMPDGKVSKGKDNINEITNPFNNNNIKVFASATNKARAASLLRGKTLTMIWYDEYAFLPYNSTIYMNAAPAFKTASMIAKQSGAPYGILITTTPGFMTTPEGKDAYDVLKEATKFSESWYDMNYTTLMNIINANTKSSFIYIKFTYQQLGMSEQWFQEISKDMRGSDLDIRREILLEWASGVENSPFRQEDIDTIGRLLAPENGITGSPVYLLGKFPFYTYAQADTRTFPPIIGVDVSSGVKHDSSTITIIDSQTTKVLGCMNCNYINHIELAKCIEFIVKNWMPNAVVNVERNGGYGSSVVATLIKMGLKRNLFYEIKDITVEEKQDGIHAYKQKLRTKVFGLNSNKGVRKDLIDLLIDRVEMHKDKFLSPIIYEELKGMEIKKNGKVEHADGKHDDQVFSYLMALYVWYFGTDLAERYGIRKTSIRTDENIDDILAADINEGTVEIVGYFNKDDEVAEEIEQDLNAFLKNPSTTMGEFLEQRHLEEKAKFEALARTPLGEKAYRQQYNIPANKPISDYVGSDGGRIDIPMHVFSSFYNPSDSDFMDSMDAPAANVAAVPENQISMLENDGYRYADHFNF